MNIRLQFCNLLPKLKSVLKLPVDRGLLQRLEQCVRQLLSEEQDPDVSTAVREVRCVKHCSMGCGGLCNYHLLFGGRVRCSEKEVILRAKEGNRGGKIKRREPVRIIGVEVWEDKNGKSKK